MTDDRPQGAADSRLQTIQRPPGRPGNVTHGETPGARSTRPREQHPEQRPHQGQKKGAGQRPAPRHRSSGAPTSRATGHGEPSSKSSTKQSTAHRSEAQRGKEPPYAWPGSFQT
jgi:hypothetical protein